MRFANRNLNWDFAMSLSPRVNFFALGVVQAPSFAVRILILSVIVPEIQVRLFPVLGPHCHLRLSVIVAITWRYFIRARRSRKSRTCRWNFDAICGSSSGVTVSGFGGHIAISGCRRCYSHLLTLSVSLP